MEDLLKLLMRDAQAAKFTPIRHACKTALELLGDGQGTDQLPAYLLREKCLDPLRLAIESRTKRLMSHAVSGIEKMLKDARFQSSIETECEDRWLPIQVLNTVYSTPNLPEDIQVDVMKLLLKMTFSTAWCMNSRIITQVAQVYIDTYCSHAHSNNVKGVVQAALTQLFGSFAEKLRLAVNSPEHAKDDVLTDFNAKGDSQVESLTDDVVMLLKFLTDKVTAAHKAGQNKQATPLLLEGIFSILTNSPPQLRANFSFQQLVWQDLCPTLISLLGLPKADVKQRLGSDHGVNMECPSLAPNTAKVIYSISVSLARMVGPVRSLRPVLESLFHRILMCTAPQHRHDAIKAVKELLMTPVTLCDLTVTYDTDTERSTKSTTPCNDLALIKLIVDSIQECCHSNDSGLCYTCVTCIGDLLTSIEQLDKGMGIRADSIAIIKAKYAVQKGKKKRTVSTRTASTTSQSDVEESSRDVTNENTNNSNITATRPSNSIHVADSDVISTKLDTTIPKHDQSVNGEKLDPKSINADDSHDNETKLNMGPITPDDSDVVDETQVSPLVPDGCVLEGSKVGRRTRVEPLQPSEAVGLANYGELERRSAKLFVSELVGELGQLLEVLDVTDLDTRLQNFASMFSDNVTRKESEYTGSVLNADSIYLTSYAALCLSLKLSQYGFYTTRDKACIPVSERQFIDSVLDTDMFLYLSPDWLAQVYKCILERDLLAEAGWNAEEDLVLITCLKDIDGQCGSAVGSQMTGDGVFMEETEESHTTNPQALEAGKLLSREIVCQCLGGILDVLSVMLTSKGACGVTNTFALMLGIEGAREDVVRKRAALCKCLDGLQKVAKLCCSLGLQERCAAVFSLLANTSCVMEDFKRATHSPPPSPAPVPSDRAAQAPAPTGPRPSKLVRLHAAHVLSMDSMVTMGLEIGSHSADCWRHVFRCCAFISELEHTYFSSGNNQSSLPRIQQETTLDNNTTLDDNDADLYGVPMAPVVPVAPRINVASLIQQSSLESGWDRGMTGGGVLNHTQASQALCGLSQQVDKLFEEAASQLSLASLTSFLGSLCAASQQQLGHISRRLAHEDARAHDHQPRLPVNSLHLYRLQGVLMRVAHSPDRPLIHLVKVWSVVSSYLVESAGHRDRSISKMAVSIVHDYIVAVMSGHIEGRHFHTNEMLCKAFENILCLELCDGDVQDQIVCSICELVEASASDIKSGWRPLFGALRAVRIEYTTVEEVNAVRRRHVEAVLDVFDVYLNTDNILVFANATVDCILCLLKYVRGPGEFEDSDDDDSDSASDYMSECPGSENLCLPALQYLKQCSVILQSMWNMPACPVFHGAKRIQVNTAHRCVDPNIPNMDFKKFSKYFLPVDDDLESSNSTSGFSSLSPRLGLLSAEERNTGDSTSLQSNDSGILITNNKDCGEVEPTTRLADPGSLEELDNRTGILHVWFLLLEGLSGAVSACPRSYQPQTMETMFELLKSASHVPGTQFAVYCMNHLLLPMLQTWLRSGARRYGYWDTGATNFKQCCGHTTDLLVDLIHEYKDNTSVCALLESVLVRLLQVLTECVAQPYEVISRLGCSCIRHILLSASVDFTDAMWQIVIDGLQGALDVTTYSVRQLMLVFHASSENFYGDVGQVKVATRRDTSITEVYRIWHLAQQVFLLDSQMSVDPPATTNNDEDKSYVLLLYPPGYENSLNPDHILARIPFRSIVVGLLSHQLLLQTIGCILLEGNAKPDSPMPGMLSQLTTGHVTQLLGCLRGSYQLACEFDLRPGLKFLLQKVARTPVAVNLYKQAGASMVFYIHTLIKICSSLPGLTLDTVRQTLEQEGMGEHSARSENKGEQPLQNDSKGEHSEQNEEKREHSMQNEDKEEHPLPNTGQEEFTTESKQGNQADMKENERKDGMEEENEDVRQKEEVVKEQVNEKGKEVDNGKETFDEIEPGNQEMKGEGDEVDQSQKADNHRQTNEETGATSDKTKSSKPSSKSESAKAVLPTMIFYSVSTETESESMVGKTTEKSINVVSNTPEKSDVLSKTSEKSLDVLSKSSEKSEDVEGKTTEKSVDVKQKGQKLCGSGSLVENGGVFVCELRWMCEELCSTYMDIVYDKAGTSCVDSLGQQQLFFLLAQPDEFPLDNTNNNSGGVGGRFGEHDDQEVVATKADVSDLPPLSPSHAPSRPARSKREMRDEQESRVYNLATDKLIHNLMTEYKKRKNQNVMPTFTKKDGGKKDGGKKGKRKKSSGDPVEEIIEQQQQSSIMKDSEAHVQSWTELLCTILGLLQQLDDAQFSMLLPCVFDCVNHLVCHAQEMRLREELAQWLHRVGRLFSMCVKQAK